jgi:hypothetical protein
MSGDAHADRTAKFHRAESASAQDFTPVASLRYTARHTGGLAGLKHISTVIFRWVDGTRCLTGVDAGHSRCSLRLVACNNFRPDGAQEISHSWLDFRVSMARQGYERPKQFGSQEAHEGDKSCVQKKANCVS